MITQPPTPKQSPKPLRYWRRLRLLSQRDLGARAGVTASTIYHLERGHNLPQLRVMRLICDALGVSYTDVEEFVASMAEAER